MTRKDEVEMEPCTIGLLGKKVILQDHIFGTVLKQKYVRTIKMLKPKSPRKIKCFFNLTSVPFFFVPIQFTITRGRN